MTITAKFTNEDNTVCNIRLEPGDHLASINVQGEATIPAYTIPAHTRPGFTLDGVDYPAKDVPAEHVAEVHIPAGEPAVYSVPCRDDNPIWTAFLARVEAGEAAEPEAWEAPPHGPTIVTKFDFWDRMSEQECEQAEEAIAAQTTKKRRTFETAQTLRSDNELWGLLVQLTEGLFGKDRAAQILAPSVS